MLEDEEKTKKRVRGEEKQQLLEVLANYSISVSGHPLSQDLINVILRLWARASLLGVNNAREVVCEWVGISRRKMQELITEVYVEKEMPEKKKKQRKWLKGPKIEHETLKEAAQQIRDWNRAGSLASMARLARWLKEEKGVEVNKERLRHYIRKMGFEWGEVKKKGELFESERVRAWRRAYIDRRVMERAEGRQRPTYFLDETYVHQNHAPNYTWFLRPEGNAVGTPAGKGQRLILLHAGGEKGWIPGAQQMWVVKKSKSKTADYHENVDHSIFVKWFEEKVCHAVPEPSTFVMDNAGYHKVKTVSVEEKEIFEGRTFSNLRKSQLQRYLSHHRIKWEAGWTRDKLYHTAKEVHEASPPAIYEIAHRYGHNIIFLPPYHSDFNPIENMWGIVKGYVARNRRQFAMGEIERLTKEGVEHVTPEMWKKAIAKVEKMEDELFVNDIYDEIN